MTFRLDKAFVLCAAIALLPACTMKVHRVELESSRLVGDANAKVACSYRQGEVVDARPSKGRGGGLGKHLFLVEDATSIVRAQLEAAGVSAGASGEVVDARLLHMYMTQNQISKIPVVVLSASIAKQPAFTLRSQTPSMNWNGTENEAYSAYERAFDDVMGQLIGRLNSRCHST